MTIDGPASSVGENTNVICVYTRLSNTAAHIHTHACAGTPSQGQWNLLKKQMKVPKYANIIYKRPGTSNAGRVSERFD